MVVDFVGCWIDSRLLGASLEAVTAWHAASHELSHRWHIVGVDCLSGYFGPVVTLCPGSPAMCIPLPCVSVHACICTCAITMLCVNVCPVPSVCSELVEYFAVFKSTYGDDANASEDVARQATVVQLLDRCPISPE